MKNLWLTASFLLAAATITAPQALSQTKPVLVDIKNSDGRSIGTAALTPAERVKIKLDIKDLPPGEHFHSYPSSGQM
jgi:hypothetical protein